ncbi:benzoate/H(+) symporter BenE family transporter [Roseivivax sp. THAF197b]|uniref:benzoate/H(+) symporter BenE family transporter n=1 Tax=Roseivivax sp. THAF197b TaxID=2588299 RepID=UPI0020C79406|nr:benzoate/H(+) symporter BenE family transporter [Roseivivax sp. THAF197b]
MDWYMANVIAQPIAHLRGILRDASLTAVAAGFLAVLISIAGPLLIYLQAAVAMDVDPGLFSSWVAAIFAGAGAASLILSMWMRIPVLVAWSAPGNVLLVTVGPSLGYSDIIGAYIISALAILIIGVTGAFDRLVRLVPAGVAAGMMAGILFQFGSQAFLGFETAPILVAVLLLAFLVLSRTTPRYAMIWLLAGSLLYMALTRTDTSPGLSLTMPELIAIWPSFSLDATLSFALPLVVTTLTGQFLAGMAILKVNGFAAPARPILTTASLLSLPVALFGGITVALASITMALGASEESHADRERRYVAGVASGAFFIIGAVCAGSIVALLRGLPTELIALLAGLALLGAIAKGMGDMLADAGNRQAGLLTFVVTASGVSLLGIGAAFWGLIAGLLAVQIERAFDAMRPSSSSKGRK